jgi:hypothetical protein
MTHLIKQMTKNIDKYKQILVKINWRCFMITMPWWLLLLSYLAGVWVGHYLLFPRCECSEEDS